MHHGRLETLIYLHRLSKAGFKRKEPNEVPVEQANTLRNLIDVHMTINPDSAESLSALARANPTVFSKTYFDDPSNPQLRLAT